MISNRRDKSWGIFFCFCFAFFVIKKKFKPRNGFTKVNEISWFTIAARKVWREKWPAKHSREDGIALYDIRTHAVWVLAGPHWKRSVRSLNFRFASFGLMKIAHHEIRSVNNDGLRVSRRSPLIRNGKRSAFVFLFVAGLGSLPRRAGEECEAEIEDFDYTSCFAPRVARFGVRSCCLAAFFCFVLTVSCYRRLISESLRSRVKSLPCAPHRSFSINAVETV